MRPPADRTADASRLGPSQREDALAGLRATSSDQPLDVLVVGGGVVGCGAALDAAARGLSVILVEAGDLAGGTSSRSSRLAHGGLRYLEHGELGLVHEALTERGLLLDRLAPHLVRRVPFLLPATGGLQRAYLSTGVALYDALSRAGARGGAMPHPRMLSAEAALGLAPGLKADAVRGAVRFHDAQIDDARHTVALARTAASRGAGVATRVRVVDLVRSAGSASDGHRPPTPGVTGAVVVDGDSGERLQVHARVVLSATGVWTDDLMAMATGKQGAQTVRRSRGVHLVVPGACIRSTTAVIARTQHSVLFLLPWDEQWLVGTTDTDDAGPRESPGVTMDDVDYLLIQANRWLQRPLRLSDVLGVYSGLRPLLSTGAGDTTEVSREHAVLTPVPGFVAVAGGKYTTYRVMAADAVDAAVRALPRMVGRSSTDQIPLVGAVGFREAWAARARRARLAGVDVVVLERLLRRHGDRTEAVLELVAADPTLGAPLHPEGHVLRAEAVVAARDEGARTLGDILIRRTRLAVHTRDRAASAARATAELVAPLLGWSEADIGEQVRALATEQPAVPAPAG